MNANDIYQGRKFTVYGTRGVEATILECDYEADKAIIFRNTPFDAFVIVFYPQIYKEELIWGSGYYANTLKELAELSAYHTHTEIWYDVSEEEFENNIFKEESRNKVVFGRGYTLEDFYKEHGETTLIKESETGIYTYKTKNREIRYVIVRN